MLDLDAVENLCGEMVGVNKKWNFVNCDFYKYIKVIFNQS